MTAHILIIEDNVEVAGFIEAAIKLEGYYATVVRDGISGLTMAREVQPDLVILNWILPGIQGMEVCRRLRTTGNQVPVIVLTAQDKVVARLAGLDAGADDCVTRPFSSQELLARVRAQLRRAQPETPKVLHFADLSINCLTRRAFRGLRQLELTAKEYDLLEYLIQHPRQVISRSRLLERVWGYNFESDSKVIKVYIRYLRLKLEKNQENRLIYTVRGVGYVLREKTF